jgi:DNA-directed RNA polymerase subunit RPC12/RpoP
VGVVFRDVVLEVLGWVGLVFGVLVVFVVLGAMFGALLVDWEFGVALLMVGVIVVPVGIVVSYYVYRIWLYEKEYLHPPRFVACPYCGMKNDVVAQFCVRCGKAIPEHVESSVHKRVDSD